MSKRRQTLRIRIPTYQYPRNSWRRAIYAVVIRAARAEGVVFVPDDKLELNITLYLDDADLRYHDVDNRLKDIMDALQGRVGGLKSKRQLEPIIPNDHQVFKVTIEKMPSPAQGHVMGHMIIKKYKPIAKKGKGSSHSHP